MSEGLLSGIRIVESSMLGPAEMGGFLADLGADVIKIEPPGGDYGRQMTWPIVEGSSLLSLHVNLTPATTHLIDQKALAKMRRSAYLINTSRGPVVDEAALAWALHERLISGAALDVYEKEPVVHADLLGLENVLLIPHLASATTETRTAMADLAISNVLHVLDGRAPLTPVA